MEKQTVTMEKYLFETAYDSYTDMYRQVKNAGLIVSQQMGWRLYLTFKGLKVAKTMAHCAQFVAEMKELFSDHETMLGYADVSDLLEIVREYDELLAKYKEHVVKLYDLAFINTTVDSEERFNAYCCGGRILN